MLKIILSCKTNFIFCFLIICNCLTLSGQDSWSSELPGIGTFSSPRVTDLNRDGYKDIILGGGGLEFQKSDTAIFALDGKTGKLLWRVSANDQIFGSAGLLDVTKDGVDDVFISGRSSEFKAINGATGNVIWSFDTTSYSNKRWFNFYNPQFINDIDGDGFNDIIISNGGDIWVPPYNPDRAAGRICIISSRSGSLLSDAVMPDQREIYMSVSIDIDSINIQNSKIIFGTGGETVKGNLYVGTLQMILNGSLNDAILIDSSLVKGFISPPAWVDITLDKNKDIVVASVDGRLMAYDGLTYKKLWEVSLSGTEAYSSMGIGHFNRDDIPDFFISYAQGSWPNLTWTKQAKVNGKNGKVEYLDSLGYYQTSSPIVVDLTDDGIDEVILSVDYQVYDKLNRKSFYTTLYAFDFTTNEAIQLVDGLPGHNVSSTPWIGDLDDDGLLEIVYCHGTNASKTYTFDGLRVNKLNTQFKPKRPVKWGAYMGSFYNGVYK